MEMTSAQSAAAEVMGYHDYFKLQSQLISNYMILFDENGVLRKYHTVEEILTSFYRVRFDLYVGRKLHLMGKLAAEASRLQNQARFILEKIDGTIIFENLELVEMIGILIQRGYDPDPVKAWEQTIKEDGDNEPDFSYIWRLQVNDFVVEGKNALLAERDAKVQELDAINNKEPKQLWLEDLESLENELKDLYGNDD